jgi:hypothetical protein
MPLPDTFDADFQRLVLSLSGLLTQIFARRDRRILRALTHVTQRVCDIARERWFNEVEAQRVGEAVIAAVTSESEL